MNTLATIGQRFRGRRRTQRGSVTLYMVVMVFGLFMMIGLVVDGGGKVRALQHAKSVAAEAARAGGQEVDGGRAVAGDGAKIDPFAARRAALRYLTEAGVEGKVTVLNGTTLRVETTDSYDPVFLDLVGLGEPMEVTGSAEVRLVTGVDGQEVQ